MDRPEWSAVNPANGEVYFTLTNNSARTAATADAANPRAYTDAKGTSTSSGNVNGHIVRIREGAGATGATAFTWDVYLFGAEAGADPGRVNLSSLTADQDFSSPDGIVFSRATGICWIQTDDGAYTDTSNCMMLAAVPGSVGDGASRTLLHALPDGTTREVTTRVGATPTPATLKRFLVGPGDCEITGCAETPDGRAMFINIQHPGESISAATVGDPSKYLSHWPGNAGYGAGGATSRPRSATIVITKDDGGRIGG
jgi:secreted PhoX family phosphatase